MTYIYYAKIYLITETDYKVIALPTFGADEYDARQNIEQLIKKFEGVKKFEVLKVTQNKIVLGKYVVCAIIKYTTGKSKQIKINLKVETKKEAETIFRKIISDWVYVANFEIKSINERD